MTTCVVDTNVLVVANQENHEAGEECRLACTRKLRELGKNGVVVLDEAEEILDEYKGKLFAPDSAWDIGRKFLMHLIANQGNPQCCELVRLTKSDIRGYEEFPNDGKLRKILPNDRKFVAVAITSPRKPPICHATDRIWWDCESALGQYGVIIDHLCPDQAPPGFGENGA